MTLLNAPEFDERKENRRRNIWVGSGIFIAVMVVLTVAGFLLGHGWLFTNLPAEHRMNVFLTAVQVGDYPKAFGSSTTMRTGSSIRKSMPTIRYSGSPKTLRRRASGRTGDVIPCGLLEARRDGDGGCGNHQRNDQFNDEDPAIGWDDGVLSV